MHDDNTDHIRLRAYQLWEAEGRPHGKDAEHWRRAQEEFAATDGGAHETTGAGAPAMSTPSDPDSAGAAAAPFETAINPVRSAPVDPTPAESSRRLAK